MNYNNSHHFGHCQTATTQDGCSLSDLVGFSIMEQWKDIKGFEGCYQVSNHGRIKSLHRKVKWGKFKRTIPERIMARRISKSIGYDFVKLARHEGGKNYTVHRLVAYAFIPNPENKPQINHIDCDRANNHIDNLEWVTPSENILHAIKMGNVLVGEKRHTSKLTSKQVLEIRSSNNISKILAKKFGVTRSNIDVIRRGETWKHLLNHQESIGI